MENWSLPGGDSSGLGDFTSYLQLVGIALHIIAAFKMSPFPIQCPHCTTRQSVISRINMHYNSTIHWNSKIWLSCVCVCVCVCVHVCMCVRVCVCACAHMFSPAFIRRVSVGAIQILVSHCYKRVRNTGTLVPFHKIRIPKGKHTSHL